MVDDAIDECRGAGRVREDGRPFLEREVRGEDDAFSLVATADDLEEKVGIAIVEGQIPDLVNLCGAPHKLTHVECLLM